MQSDGSVGNELRKERKTAPMTIYDIARMAGVSASTVSRVINDKPGIKPETRKKVQKLLKEYNYIPNENARGLVTKVSKLIGILVGDIRNIHHTTLAYVVEQYLRDKEYCIIIMNVGNDPQVMAENIQVLEQRKVDGIIMIGSIFQNEVVGKAMQECGSELPVVMCNGYINLPNVYGVLVDEREGVCRCIELLYKKGYRNIAFIGEQNTISNRQKRSGYVSSLQELEDVAEPVMVEAIATAEDGYEVTEALMKQYPKTDAIIYADDIVAAGGIRYCNETGIKIPEQVGIVGINNATYCEITYPTLTSLDNRMAEMGLVAATTLVDVLEGNEKPEKIMLFSKVIERGSTNRTL